MVKTECLPLFEGLVNASVLPEDELRLSEHCRAMFKRLKRGPATNVELQELTNSLNATARRSDIRKELQRVDWDLRLVKKKSGGVNVYAIVRPDGTLYPHNFAPEDYYG